MRTSINPVSKSQLAGLISELGPDRMGAGELGILCDWIAKSAFVWSGVHGDRLLCLWGLMPPTLLSDQAYLWLHTTEAVKEHEFVLVRRSQIELKKMLERYPRIVGHCEVGAERSIRWLTWLGAEFGAIEGALVPFVIRSNNG